MNYKTDISEDGCTPFGMTLEILDEIQTDESERLAWFYRAMSSACNERFEQGCGI